MTYGLTSTGFVIQTLPDIIAESQAGYRGIFGQEIQLDQNPPSVYDQLIAFHADREASIWQVMQALYLAGYPDSATGVPLANVVTITGETPLPAVASSTVLTLSGTPGTIVPAGSQAGLTGTTFVFATSADATIGGGGTITVAAICTETGPTVAVADTITTIITPIAGWASVTNAAAAIAGNNVETDAALRARRALDIATGKAGIVESVRQAVLAVNGVTFASVVENRTDGTVNSIPPHALAVTVTGGTDADVAQAIWNTHGGGINTYGSTSVDVTDSEGAAQTVHFTRSTPVAVYVTVTLTRNPLYPAGGDALVKAAIMAYGATLNAGQSVTDFPMVLALGAAAVPGIDRAAITFGLSPSPGSNDDLPMARDEVATFSSGHTVIA